MAEERPERLELKVDDLGVRLDENTRRLDDLNGRLDENTRTMHVLHEDLVDRIKALAPDFGPIRREFRREHAELRESIERRLVPLEATERARRRTKR